MIRSVCVFCGSNPGSDPMYANTAHDFGVLLAKSNVTLVYGGGHVGLMGIVADAVLAGGGKAIGVIPRMLWDREVGHRSLTELHIVESIAATPVPRSTAHSLTKPRASTRNRMNTVAPRGQESSSWRGKSLPRRTGVVR